MSNGECFQCNPKALPGCSSATVKLVPKSDGATCVCMPGKCMGFVPGVGTWLQLVSGICQLCPLTPCAKWVLTAPVTTHWQFRTTQQQDCRCTQCKPQYYMKHGACRACTVTAFKGSCKHVSIHNVGTTKVKTVTSSVLVNVQICRCTDCNRQYYKVSDPMPSGAPCARCPFPPGCVPSTVHHVPNQRACICDRCNSTVVHSPNPSTHGPLRRLLGSGHSHRPAPVYVPFIRNSHDCPHVTPAKKLSRRLMGHGHSHRPHFHRRIGRIHAQTIGGYYHFKGTCLTPRVLWSKCTEVANSMDQGLAKLPPVDCGPNMAIVSFTLTSTGCKSPPVSPICPNGWKKLDNYPHCKAPTSYGGECDHVSQFKGYTNRRKSNWATKCKAPWTLPGYQNSKYVRYRYVCRNVIVTATETMRMGSDFNFCKRDVSDVQKHGLHCTPGFVLMRFRMQGSCKLQGYPNKKEGSFWWEWKCGKVKQAGSSKRNSHCTWMNHAPIKRLAFLGSVGCDSVCGEVMTGFAAGENGCNGDSPGSFSTYCTNPINQGITGWWKSPSSWGNRL